MRAQLWNAGCAVHICLTAGEQPMICPNYCMAVAVVCCALLGKMPRPGLGENIL